MSVCKRTHQLKRQGTYWTIARTACGKEKDRDETTTAADRVTCPDCLRDLLMVLDLKIKTLQENMAAQE